MGSIECMNWGFAGYLLYTLSLYTSMLSISTLSLSLSKYLYILSLKLPSSIQWHSMGTMDGDLCNGA